MTNPLLGRRGAAVVFGPQKGADAGRCGRARQRSRPPGVAAAPASTRSTPGAGRRRRHGFRPARLGATLEPGSVAVAELIGLPAAAVAASVVITGEGSFDGQSAAGKVPAHVAECRRPVRPSRSSRDGSRRMPTPRPSPPSLSLTDLAGSPEAAMKDPATWLWEAGRRFARDLG